MGSRPHLRTPYHRPTFLKEGKLSPPSIPPMRHRTHDHLFAAAGVTAALSLIGTGVTVLKGSVLEFSAWPVVGHDQPRRVTLPVAPVVLAPNGGTSSRVAAIDGRSGGNEFPTLSGLTRGQSPITSLDFNVSAPVIVPRNGGTAGQGTTGRGRTQGGSDVTAVVQGSAGSLGVFGSAGVDGKSNNPVVAPAPAGDPRTVGGTDDDQDGVPDSWATDTGTPSTVTNVVSDVSGRDTVAPSFTAEDPGTDPSAGTPAPTDTAPTTPVEPTPVPADPAPTSTDKTPSTPSPAPTPADPTPPSDTTTSTPAPSADPAPQTPPADTDSDDDDDDEDDAPAQPAPPADPAPAADPAPSQAPADPAPAQAPDDPAPAQAPADPAPPAAATDGDDCAPAAPAAEANAAVPQSAQ
jgi:hypothetical protein